MLRTVNWLARALGFAWLGLLAFVIAPARGPFAVPVQVAGYCLLGLGLLAWALIELQPATARHRTRSLAVVLGVIAVACGFASGAGYGGSAMVAFGFVAAMIAGGDTGLVAALAVTAAGILATEISGLAFGGSYGALLGLPVIVVAGLLIGRNRGAYRIQAEQTAQLLAQREQLQAEQRRADLLDERARIAREIHDVLAHSLGALGIQIQAARAVLTDHGDIDRAGEILAAAQRMAAEGLVDTRRAVHALRADTLPLDEELARVSDTHAQRYRVAASFDVGGVPGPLPPDATIALLRITQESLVNAAKHAAGQSVAVRLDYADADVRLTVRNDLPPGADLADAGHIDTGHIDTGHIDTGHTDTGHTDTGHTDTGHTDTGHTDTSHTDTSHTDTSHTDTGHTDTGHTDTGLAPGSGAGGPAGVSTVNGGYGLTGMRERLRLLNGTLEAGRRDNQWIVTAELPRPQPEHVMS